MLLTFSEYMRDHKDELIATTIPKATPASFILYGGRRDAIAGIICMMKWWCNGLQAVPEFEEDSQFTAALQLLKAAQDLQVPDEMNNVIIKRVNEILVMETPTLNDLKAAYTCVDDEVDPTHPEDWSIALPRKSRLLLIESWAVDYVRGNVETDEDVESLFSEISELKRDLKEAIVAEQYKFEHPEDLDEESEEEDSGSSSEDEDATIVDSGGD